MSSLRKVLEDFSPPLVVRIATRLFANSFQFQEGYDDWNEASTNCSGYQGEQILSKVLDATLRVKRGEAAYERDSVLFEKIDYSWPIVAGIMWAAAQNNGALNVLDFGGALGSSYFQNKTFLDSLPEVKWNVVEQSHYVEVGQAHIQDENLRFYHSIDACFSENRPNVILLSSVLQYLQSPIELLKQLDVCNASVMIIDRTPFANLDIDTLVIQRVPAYIYKASYPMWIFSWDKFIQEFSECWELITSNLSPEGYSKTNRHRDFYFKSLLFKSK